MTRTVTGIFESRDQVRNAVDELISTGFDREKVFGDEQNFQVKVMIPEAVEREVVDILKRHNPKEVR